MAAAVLIENKMAAKVGVSCLEIISALIVVKLTLLNSFLLPQLGFKKRNRTSNSDWRRI